MPPKSAKQRAKEYRERKKLQREENSENSSIPISDERKKAAERTRLYRERKRQAALLNAQTADSCDSSTGSNVGTKIVKKKSKPMTAAERSRLHRERKRLEKFPNGEKKISLFKAWCDEKRRSDKVTKTQSVPSSIDVKVYEDQFVPGNLEQGTIPTTFELPGLEPEESVMIHKRTADYKIPDRTIAPLSTEICSSTAMVNTVQTPLLWIGTDSSRMENSTYDVSASTQNNQLLKTSRQESTSQLLQESTSVNPDVVANLELELTTPDSASDQEMKIKEEPMSESEDDGSTEYQNVYHPSTVTDTVSHPGAFTAIVPSVLCVKSLSDRSSGEILGVPVGELPSLPGAPLSQSVTRENRNTTNYVQDKNRLQPNPNSVKGSAKETRTIKEEPMSEPEEDSASGDASTVINTVSRLGASTIIVPSILCVKSLSHTPPSESVSAENLNAMNGVLEKNRLPPNPNSLKDSVTESRTIKEEPVPEPEEGGASEYQNVYAHPTVTDKISLPGASTVIVDSVLRVKGLSERSSREILGMPVTQLPSLPCDPPVGSVSGYHPNVTKGILEKNWLHLNPSYVNECREVMKVLPEYRTRDQFDVYGEYIASKLRRLDWKISAYVQKTVSNIISQAEKGNYNQVNESCS